MQINPCLRSGDMLRYFLPEEIVPTFQTWVNLHNPCLKLTHVLRTHNRLKGTYTCYSNKASNYATLQPTIFCWPICFPVQWGIPQCLCRSSNTWGGGWISTRGRWHWVVEWGIGTSWMSTALALCCWPSALCCWHIGLVLLAHWLGAAGPLLCAYDNMPEISRGHFFLQPFFAQTSRVSSD